MLICTISKYILKLLLIIMSSFLLLIVIIFVTGKILKTSTYSTRTQVSLSLEISKSENPRMTTFIR